MEFQYGQQNHKEECAWRCRVQFLDWTFASVLSHKVLDEKLHNNLTSLSFPSVGSPKLKVLEVQLKELFISPFTGAGLERSCLGM